MNMLAFRSFNDDVIVAILLTDYDISLYIIILWDADDPS